MIEVVVIYKENKVKEFFAKGHADAGPYGHDLVCAAVSAAITGCFNALEYFDEYYVELKEGFAFFKNEKDFSSYHDEVVLSTMVTILATIEQTAPDSIKIDENHLPDKVN